MTLRDMLGAVRACVQLSGAGKGVVTAAEPIVDARPGTTSVEVDIDVPDLGPLQFLGTDKIGRQVAETTNLHWRAYAKQC